MQDDLPFRVIGADRPGRWIVTADHASNRVPPEVAGGDLGLPPAEMARHIAWDPGVAGVARRLGEILDSPVIEGRFSRLVIDPNRGEDDPTVLMRLYDGTIIPANRDADAAERERRLALFHRPYHAALGELMARPGAVMLAVHSFTPAFVGRPPRPWHVAVLSASDRRLTDPLLARLRREADLVVGDNEPYGGHLPGDSVDRHCLPQGRLHALIELRQDVIAEEAQQARWAERLAPMLEDALAEASGNEENEMDADTRTRIEAAAFRRLQAHLQSRTDVQNIDMMTLAGFCRNCLSGWMQDAAEAEGAPMTKAEAREAFYGEPYEAWRAKHQTEATPEQTARFAKAHG